MIDLQMSCKEDLSLCPIFRQMAPSERSMVLEHVQYLKLNLGQTLLREGDVHRGLYILVSGRCEVVKETVGNTEQQLATLDSGAIFGEVSFFSAAPHSATVRALEAVEVMHLPFESFLRLRLEHPEVAMQLILNMGRLLAERFRRMDQYTYDLFAKRRTVDDTHHQRLQTELYADRVQGL